MASVNFKEGLCPQGTWRWGLGALVTCTRRGHWAVCHAPKSFDEKLTEKRLHREAPKWCLLSAPSLVSLYWESLHRFELLPCWSAAGWRPPASCRGYRMPWALEPPSWMGGCPNNWVATAPEA